MAHRLIAVVGPTASGKSALALALAERCRGEVVSCDSLQVYRGLDIGSAKATPDERARVTHHLLDLVAPDEDFSAADYARQARAAVADILARGRRPVVAGGTGLYLRALLHGLFPGPPRDPELRQRLTGIADRWGNARLHRLLRRVDPGSASRIPRGDRIRMVRALEVFFLSGRPLTEHFLAAPAALPGVEVLVLGLDPGQAALRAAVVARTQGMWENGLLDEVRGLLEQYPPTLRPLQAIGYRQAVAVVRGETDEAAALRDIVLATMRYAKRQRTWFRHQEQVSWCADAPSAMDQGAAWLENR